MKRFIPIFLCLCVCISVFAFSVSAKDTIVDGRTIIDYEDYITGYDLNNVNDGWAYIKLEPSFFGSRTFDPVNGERFFEDGNREFTMYCDSGGAESSWAVCYYPGASITNTFMKLENLPNGSKFYGEFSMSFLAHDYQTEFRVTCTSGVVYYDSNFGVVSHDTVITEYYVDSNDFIDNEDFNLVDIMEITINQPAGAVYCVFECEFNLKAVRSNDQGFIPVRCQFGYPGIKMSTTYTQIIINSIINSKKPVGSSGIVDVDELEDYLKDSTSDGREDADEVFNEAPNLLVSHLSGFLFMTSVIEVIYSAGWIRGILTVSLALGLLGFITNLATSIGRAVEHRGKGAGKS